jgi:hypothetical protein
MKINRSILFLLAAFLFFTSCNKNKEQAKTAADFLTDSEWVLVNYGDDLNNNNVLDISERGIMECQRDNSYLFNKNGSGIIRLDATGCGEGIRESSFAWRLVDNNTSIDFIFGISSIMALNESEMILYNDANGQSKKLFFIYHRPS